jgi:hypothetical protein
VQTNFPPALRSYPHYKGSVNFGGRTCQTRTTKTKLPELHRQISTTQQFCLLLDLCPGLLSSSSAFFNASSAPPSARSIVGAVRATSSVLRRSIPADSRGAKEDGPILFKVKTPREKNENPLISYPCRVSNQLYELLADLWLQWKNTRCVRSRISRDESFAAWDIPWKSKRGWPGIFLCTWQRAEHRSLNQKSAWGIGKLRLFVERRTAALEKGS